jgi:hypothetical protein
MRQYAVPVGDRLDLDGCLPKSAIETGMVDLKERVEIGEPEIAPSVCEKMCDHEGGGIVTESRSSYTGRLGTVLAYVSNSK